MPSLELSRRDLFTACAKRGAKTLANMGDGAIYSYRYRAKLPEEIKSKQPPGKEWVILERGISKYEFRLVPQCNIEPNEQLRTTKVPDATPEIIKRYGYSDEQALLARFALHAAARASGLHRLH